LAVPSVVLADFGVHYEREHWRAALNLTNAFDQTYVASCSSATACFYGQKSRAVFSLAYRW
jgi:iron complex outermembrane receptor protein